MKKLFKKSFAFLIAALFILPLVPHFTIRSEATVNGSLPELRITIDEGYVEDDMYDLSDPAKGKNAKLRAHVTIDGAEDEAYNIAEEQPIEIKTRGNSTLAFDKKPYQIKFDVKRDLFGMGAAKKWILLANYLDGTMIRTKLFFDLADEIGMKYTCKSTFVDLYIDGSYKGVYQLIEKVEIGGERVKLKNDYGVLLEMDADARYTDGDIIFRSATFDRPFVYKDYVTDFEKADMTQEEEDLVDAIKAATEAKINAFEAAITAAEPDWNTIKSMIDVDSFALYYLLNEYAEQVDCMFSSTYFYFNGPDDKIHCGPCWDFDRTNGFNDPVDADADYIKNPNDFIPDKGRCEWYKELFRNPEFAARVNELYDERCRAAFDTTKVNAAIAAYQTELMPSLRMNHQKFVVFYDRNNIAADLTSGTTDQLVAYTTNHLKSVLAAKKNYMDIAYGKEVPVISYKTYTTGGTAAKSYTGGCMTPASTLTGLKVDLSSSIYDGTLIYRMYCGGTQTDVSNEGEINHASGGYVNATGIYIRLQGNIENYVSVQYRVRRDSAWSAWISDGSLAGGSSGSAIDRIQVRLVRKAGAIPYASANFYVNGAVAKTEYKVPGNAFATSYTYPTTHGKRFVKWYTDSGLQNELVQGFNVTSNAVYNYYAELEDIEVGPGDADGDGKVTSRDISDGKKHILCIDLEYFNVEAADMNNNGVVTAKDLFALKKMVAGITP